MKSLLSVLFIFLALSSTSQDLNSINGKVTSKDGALSFVTVSLHDAKDSKMVKATITDSAGSFVFKNLVSGTYFVKITHVGYMDYASEHFKLSAPLHMGVITMQARSQVLTEVKVSSQKPLIEEKIDKTVMNVENSILATGNSALELLEQAPYVSVDGDGNVTMRGIQGVTIMIDGKLTYLSSNDLANLLRNTPASQIAQIEIISNPSSRFDAAGNGGVINIKMKKNQTIGLNGAVNSTYQQGRLPRLNSGINLNFRKGKTNVYGGLTHSYMRRWNEETTVTRFLDGGVEGSTFDVSENTFYYTRSLNARAGVDYMLSKKTTLGVLANASGGGENLTSENTNYISNKSVPDSSLLTASESDSKWKRIAGNVNLVYQIDSLGRLVTVDFDMAGFYDSNRPIYNTNYFNHLGAKTNSLLLTGSMNTKVQMLSFKSDYETPFGEKGMVTSGIKTSYVRTTNSIKYFANGLLDKGRSNDFDYTEIINAAYIDYGSEKGRLNYKVGVRAEQTIARGDQVTSKSTFRRNYTQLFPSLFLRYKWSEKQSTTLTTNRRIGRPDYESLNPFLYFSDPYNTWSGNPLLRPTITYGVNVTQSYKGMVNLFFGYSKSVDMLSRVQVRDSVTSGVLATWENLRSSNQFSIGLSGNVKPAKWWRMNSNFLLFRTNSSGQLGAISADRSLTSYRLFTNNSLKLSRKWDAEVSFWYRPSQLWGLSRTAPVGNLSVGIQRKIFKNEGTVKLVLADVFRQMIMNTDANYVGLVTRSHVVSENRAVRLSFSYRFGKKQVKAERERTTALEDESGRVRGRD